MTNFILKLVVAATLLSPINAIPLNADAPPQTYTEVETETPQPTIPAILQRIAFCESSNRQFNPDGSVLRGKINPQDIGKFQINLIYHGEAAKKLGFDLFTESGNTAYAVWLYNAQGTQPWFWSRSCWLRP